MSATTTRLRKAMLTALHYSGADRLLAPLARGQGVIFTLHQVQAAPPKPFEPNRILKVTPDFLEGVLRHVIEAGFEVLSLDQVHARLTGETESERPFACFTFDDGYRDNLTEAYPVFQRYGAPFAIYVPTDYPDGEGELWWLALEHVIRESTFVTLDMGGTSRRFDCTTTARKNAAYEAIYWWLRSLPEARARDIVRGLAAGVGLDMRRLCRELIMSWSQIRQLAADPLVTIGAHTRRHLAVAKLSEAEAIEEIKGSVARIEAELGRPCRHFSFPYGDEGSASERDFRLVRELGLKTAVTTRKGLVTARDAACLGGLPRTSLNGDYQQRHYVKVLLSGVPFMMMQMVRRQPTPTVPASAQ